MEAGEVDTYALTSDYEETEDLGTLTPKSGETFREFTIDGGGDKDFKGGNHNGIIVGTGNILNLDNIDEISDWNMSVATNNGGTININSDGGGTTNLNSKLDGTGIFNNGNGSTLNVQDAGNLAMGECGINNAGIINLSNGILGGKIIGGNMNVSGGIVESKAKYMGADNNVIANDGKLIITDDGNIGKIENDGNVEFNSGVKNITAQLIGNGVYTNKSGSNLNVANAANLAMTNGINNQGVVNLKEGILGTKIFGGTMNISSGIVTSNADNILADNNNVKVDGKLILNDGTLTKNINNEGVVELNEITSPLNSQIKGGKININQNLTCNANNLQGDKNEITEGNTLNINEGIITKKIIGNGTLIIDQNMSINADNLAVSNIKFASGCTVNLTAGILENNISGETDSILQINGDVTFKGNRSIQTGIVFKNGSVFRVNASDTVGEIAAISGFSSALIERGAKLFVAGASANKSYLILDGEHNIDVHGWTLDADMADNFTTRFGLKVDTSNTTGLGDGQSKFYIQFIKDEDIVNPQSDFVSDMPNIIFNLKDGELKKFIDNISFVYENKKTQANIINTMANMEQLANVQYGNYALTNLAMDETFNHMSVRNRNLEYSSMPKYKLRNTAARRRNYHIDQIDVGRVCDVLPTYQLDLSIDNDSRRSPSRSSRYNGYNRNNYNDNYNNNTRNSDRDYYSQRRSYKKYEYISAGGQQEQMVWATYIHSKEEIKDMEVGHLKQDSSLKYNGGTVGADLWQSEHGFGGLSVTYAKGDVNSVQKVSTIKNEVDHYGANIYHRQDSGKFSVQLDAGCGKSENDIKMQTLGAEDVTLKPKTEAYSAGIKIEEQLEVSSKTNLVPFIGVRYTHMKTKETQSNIDITYGANKQDMCSVPVGLSLRHIMPFSDGFRIGTTLEGGYIFNVGDRKGTQRLIYGAVTDTVNYNIVDKGQYFIKAAIQAICENMMWELGYHYSKSSKVKDDKWYVNMNMEF